MMLVFNYLSTTVVSQEYDTDASKEYVIRGNSALLKCQFPSFMADHLQVESWMIDDGTIVIHSERYGTSHILKRNNPSFYIPPNPPPLLNTGVISRGMELEDE